VVEAAPEEAVESDDVEGHDGDAGEDLVEVAGFGGFGDVGAQAGGGEGGAAVGDDLGDDGGVPGAAGCCDAARDVGGKMAGMISRRQRCQPWPSTLSMASRR
jgi:hypothetical protein